MADFTLVVAFVLLFATVIFTAYRRATRFSVKYIRGPPSEFLLGNLRRFSYQENVGDLDAQYFKEYGMVWRVGGALGQAIVMISDPKALQHIFHKSGYNYQKPVEVVTTTNLIASSSILTANAGASHARHRKVMNPAFTTGQLRSFLPLFRRSADKLCRLLKHETMGADDHAAANQAKSYEKVVNVNTWLARTTLDVIGEAAFHYQFGALDNVSNPVTEAYHNMFSDSFLHTPLWNVLFRASWRYLPNFLLHYVKYIPTREYRRFRRTLKIISGVASTLVDDALNEMKLSGKSSGEVDQGKDVMSILVRANLSENPAKRLSKEEMMSEMSALTLAGHETTANALTWLLWELSKEPKFQDMLREEIQEKRKEIRVLGTHEDGADEVDFTMEDFESMPFLQALVKEILRYHPIVYQLFRAASRDDVIPLSEPIRTTDGRMITEIPVGKGQTVMANVCIYNRLPSIWGTDADKFNPMRFMDDSSDRIVGNPVKIGMYGNLMSFSAGIRGCIGWQFSVIEMQAILVALVENFKFSLPTDDNSGDAPEIRRMPVGLMSPMVKGKLTEGVAMPLRVTPLRS